MEKKVYIRPNMMTIRMRSRALMAGSIQQSTNSVPTIDNGTTELGSRDAGPANSSVWDD